MEIQETNNSTETGDKRKTWFQSNKGGVETESKQEEIQCKYAIKKNSIAQTRLIESWPALRACITYRWLWIVLITPDAVCCLHVGFVHYARAVRILNQMTLHRTQLTNLFTSWCMLIIQYTVRNSMFYIWHVMRNDIYGVELVNLLLLLLYPSIMNFLSTIRIERGTSIINEKLVV